MSTSSFTRINYQALWQSAHGSNNSLHLCKGMSVVQESRLQKLILGPLSRYPIATIRQKKTIVFTRLVPIVRQSQKAKFKGSKSVECGGHRISYINERCEE